MNLARLLARTARASAPLALLATMVATTAPAQAVSPPSIVITSPAEGATVTGLIGVGVVSTTDAASGDYPWSTTLYFDGATESGPQICNSPVGATTCTQNHLLTTDGLSGKHTVQAKLTTNNGITVSSAILTINVVSPPPTVAITSPAEGASVGGSEVTVTTAAAVDPTQTFDFPQTMTLVVDGTDATTDYCRSFFAATCNISLVWNTLGLPPGRHTLQARFDTSRGNSATSAPVHVTLTGDTSYPVLTLSPGQPSFVRGSSGFVTGSLTSSGTGLPIAHAPVQVYFDEPNSSVAHEVSVQTADDGTFSALDPAPLSGNTIVDASYGINGARTQLSVTVPISCTVPSSLVHGTATVTIGCHTDGLAWHSVVALRITGGSIPHAVQFAKTDSHGNVSYSMTFQHARQQLELRATTATTNTYVGSTSPTYALQIG